MKSKHLIETLKAWSPEADINISMFGKEMEACAVGMTIRDGKETVVITNFSKDNDPYESL